MKQKYQGKKKGFLRFFWWRFFICIPVLALLLDRIYMRPIFSDDVQPFGNRTYNYESIENNLLKIDSDENAFKILSDPEDYLSLLSNKYDVTKEYFWLLFQPDTGEFYTSKQYAVARIWQDGVRQICKLYDQALVERLYNSVNFYYPENMIIYSIYVKDGQFVPGEVYMQEQCLFPYPGKWDDGKTIPGEWVDLSPENTEDWTKVCSDRSKEYLSTYHDGYLGDTETDDNAEHLSRFGNMHLGSVEIIGSPNSPHAELLAAEMKAEIPKMYQERMNSLETNLEEAEHGALSMKDFKRYGASNRTEYIEAIQKENERYRRSIPDDIFYHIMSGQWDDYRNKFLPGKNYESGSETITFRGEKWMLWHFFYQNERDVLRSEYLRYWPYILIYVLIHVLIVSLIWSFISYLLYRRRYDIEAYRRNLTNALAHDLKTPLAVIYGHAENIRAHTHPESTDDYADCIMENVTHIDEMIAGVLGLAKLENKAAPKMRDTIDLTALLHQAFRRCAPQMEARGLTLKESGKLAFRGNAEMLQQLAENLVSNAVQHTAEGGEIAVTAEKRTLCISNPYTGELDEKTLCEPFRRGDTARGSDSGSGLGLSIVQQIAALHKIRLRVTARNGIFTVRLKVRSPRRKMN